MSTRSRPPVGPRPLEHQRLLDFALGLSLWAFALLTGTGILASVPLSAVLVAAVAGAVLTTIGIAEPRDRRLLNGRDFALLDGALALLLIAFGLGYLVAGETAPALVFCFTASAIGLGASATHYA